MNGSAPPYRNRPLDNASLILQTLDAHLDHAVRLVLYGRAALQLGITDAPPETAESKDVDAIIPLGDLDQLSADESFWNARLGEAAVGAGGSGLWGLIADRPWLSYGDPG